MAKQTGLRVSEDLELPLEIVTQTQVILAKKGAGKTYTAAVEIEEALKLGTQVVVLDPTGAWWGLKSSADGDRGGKSISRHQLAEAVDMSVAGGGFGARLSEVRSTGLLLENRGEVAVNPELLFL